MQKTLLPQQHQINLELTGDLAAKENWVVSHYLVYTLKKKIIELSVRNVKHTRRNWGYRTTWLKHPANVTLYDRHSHENWTQGEEACVLLSVRNNSTKPPRAGANVLLYHCVVVCYVCVCVCAGFTGASFSRGISPFSSPPLLSPPFPIFCCSTLSRTPMLRRGIKITRNQTLRMCCEWALKLQREI
jgi:hypothetical protein